MIKTFRKYQKEMLAVFMALLLIVWLGGSALTSMLSVDYSSRKLAQTRDGEIIERDRLQAEATTTILRRLGTNWQSIGGETLTLFEWIMLSREARRLGFEPNLAEAETQYASATAVVNQLANRSELTREQIYAAVAEFNNVMQSASVVATGVGELSEAEIRVATRDSTERLSVALVAFRADAMVDSEETISEEQIQATFEKYREETKGPGMSFGYFLPPKIKTQFVKIDSELIERNLRISERALDKKAHAYWKDRRNSDPAFLRPLAETESTSQPSSAPVRAYFETFAEAREAALGVVRKQEAKTQAGRIAEYLIQRAEEPWFDSKEGEDGYKVRPKDIADANYYAELITDVPANLEYPGSLSVGTTDWFSAADATQVPGLGESFMDVPGGRGRSFGQAAFSVQGLVELPDAEDATFDRSQFYALYATPSLPVRDRSGNMYIFRVSEVNPAQAPEGLEEVRDDVIADCRTQQAYDQALELAEKIKSTDASQSLEDALAAAPDVQAALGEDVKVSNAQPFVRRRLGQTGGFQAFVSPIGVVTDEFTTACFDSLAGGSEDSKPLFVHPMPDKGMVAVVQYVKLEPMSKTAYAASRQRVLQELTTQRQQQALLAWFSKGQIRARNQFEADSDDG